MAGPAGLGVTAGLAPSGTTNPEPAVTVKRSDPWFSGGTLDEIVGMPTQNSDTTNVTTPAAPMVGRDGHRRRA
jgi:hypothetical protein